MNFSLPKLRCIPSVHCCCVCQSFSPIIIGCGDVVYRARVIVHIYMWYIYSTCTLTLTLTLALTSSGRVQHEGGRRICFRQLALTVSAPIPLGRDTAPPPLRLNKKCFKLNAKDGREPHPLARYKSFRSTTQVYYYWEATYISQYILYKLNTRHVGQIAIHSIKRRSMTEVHRKLSDAPHLLEELHTICKSPQN